MAFLPFRCSKIFFLGEMILPITFTGDAGVISPGLPIGVEP